MQLLSKTGKQAYEARVAEFEQAYQKYLQEADKPQNPLDAFDEVFDRFGEDKPQNTDNAAKPNDPLDAFDEEWDRFGENGISTSEETVDFTTGQESDILNLPDIYIGHSLGAKRASIDVMDLETGETFDLADGEYIHDVQVFAGEGVKSAYRDAWKFAERYGGEEAAWQHVKGVALLNTEDGYRMAEIHWSQCEGIGRVEFFIKEWLD